MNCGINPYVRDKESCLTYLYSLETMEKRRVNVNDKYYNTLRMSVSELKI